jgi:hypothetical protein
VREPSHRAPRRPHSQRIASPSRWMRASTASQSGPQLGQHAIVAAVDSPVATKRFTGTSTCHGSGPSLSSARLRSSPSIRTITRRRSTDYDSNDVMPTIYRGLPFRSRSQPTETPATADAWPMHGPNSASHHRRARLHAEPSTRPLRTGTGRRARPAGCRCVHRTRRRDLIGDWPGFALHADATTQRRPVKYPRLRPSSHRRTAGADTRVAARSVADPHGRARRAAKRVPRRYLTFTSDGGTYPSNNRS